MMGQVMGQAPARLGSVTCPSKSALSDCSLLEDRSAATIRVDVSKIKRETDEQSTEAPSDGSPVHARRSVSSTEEATPTLKKEDSFLNEDNFCAMSPTKSDNQVARSPSLGASPKVAAPLLQSGSSSPRSRGSFSPESPNVLPRPCVMDEALSSEEELTAGTGEAPPRVVVRHVDRPASGGFEGLLLPDLGSKGFSPPEPESVPSPGGLLSARGSSCSATSSFMSVSASSDVFVDETKIQQASNFFAQILTAEGGARRRSTRRRSEPHAAAAPQRRHSASVLGGGAQSLLSQPMGPSLGLPRRLGHRRALSAEYVHEEEGQRTPLTGTCASLSGLDTPTGDLGSTASRSRWNRRTPSSGGGSP